MSERIDQAVDVTVNGRLYRVSLMITGPARVQRVIFGTFEPIRRGSNEYRAAVAAAIVCPRED